MDGIDPTSIPMVHNLGRMVAKDADEKRALKSFEAYVLGDILKRTAPKDSTGLFDGGQAGRMYQDHFYQEIARVIAENGDFGLAKQLEGHLVDAEPEEAGPDVEKEGEK